MPPPGFEPGSTARKAVILAGLDYGGIYVLRIIKLNNFKKVGKYSVSCV